MFTGIITALGTIAEAHHADNGRRIVAHVAATHGWDALETGESIACSGACLTVTNHGEEEGYRWFSADLSDETLARTAPGMWEPGAHLNLERALKLGDRLGGHFVTGHVDGVATVAAVTPIGEAHRLDIVAPENLRRFIAPKGSVTLDGVSLTVNEVAFESFSVMIIPHTWRYTTLGEAQGGRALNLEIDLLARYLDRLTQD